MRGSEELLLGEWVWSLVLPFGPMVLWSCIFILPPSVEANVLYVGYYLSPPSTVSSGPSTPALPRSAHPHPSLPAVLLPRPLIVTLVLGRACRCLTKPVGEPADAEATCLSLDRRLELVILPNEPYQLLQFLVFPHQPLYLMPKPLIICK